MIDGVTNSGAVPVLERMLQFAGRRQELIANNIANLDTPGFRPVDVSVDRFREQLGEAVDARRSAGRRGDLPAGGFDQVELRPGGMVLHPVPSGENILFHDGNDRDLERLMQDLVENFTAFRTAAELMRNQMDTLDTAIRERL